MFSMAAVRMTVRRIVSLAIIAIAGLVNAADEAGNELLAVEVATVGMDLRSGSPVVLLRLPESNQIVPIWVGMAEAQSIMWALHEIPMPRPMTHDLMQALLRNLQTTVVAVEIHDLRESTYHGRVLLQRSGEDQLREVDCRPSDGIALALRTRSPVRVAAKLLTDVPSIDFAPPDETLQVVRWLGITVVAPSPELRQEFSLPDRPGVVVREAALPAARHGVQRGDLIFAVNDAAVTTPAEFFDAVRQTARGQAIRLRLARGTEEKTIEIPADVISPPGQPQPAQPGLRA